MARKKMKPGYPTGKKMSDLVKAKRERSSKVFPYTYDDIAEAVGLKTHSVKEAARLKKFDPKNLESLVAYVYRGMLKLKKIKRLTLHTKKRIRKKEVDRAVTDRTPES